MIVGQPVRQICYAVDDVRKFADRHAHIFGSGPFLLLENVEVTGTLRGRETTFRVDVAFGQWGDIQVELMHQVSGGPGLVHELFPEGSGLVGLHHVCLIVEDIAGAVADFAAQGFEVVWSVQMVGGTSVAMVDTSDQIGHFTEVYELTDEIKALYEGVREASVGFDGTDPVRLFGSGMPADLQLVRTAEGSSS